MPNLKAKQFKLDIKTKSTIKLFTLPVKLGSIISSPLCHEQLGANNLLRFPEHGVDNVRKKQNLSYDLEFKLGPSFIFDG